MLKEIMKTIGQAIFTIFVVLSLTGCFLSGGDGDGGVAIPCGDNEAVYVRMDADDSNPGTISEPLRTIQAAVACAKPGQDIRVANGTYEVDSNNGSNIIIDEGKSIYGGYSSDFQVRDPAVYPTIINDVTDMSIFPDDQAVTVSVRTATSATVLDGFTINTSTDGGGKSLAAISISNGSPTISNNIINAVANYTIRPTIGIESNGGGIIKNNTITAHSGIEVVGTIYDPFAISNNTIINSGSGITIHAASSYEYKINNNSITVLSHGVMLNDFSIAIIEGNTISTSDFGVAVGIVTTKGAPMIRNNTIKVGSAGVSNAANSVISNNTFVGGTGSYSAGISNKPFASAVIQNNIISITGSYCIHEADANSDPASVNNNDLTGCESLYFDEGTTFIYDIADVNTLTGTAASGNISIPPNLDYAQDYRLTGASPVEVTQGGLDLSSDFNTDKAGNTRTVPWSMGAYEYD